MSGYGWPYTQQQVVEVEEAADDLARMLHDPFAKGKQAWRAMEPETLSELFYDAMVALQERMINGEGF